MASTLLSLCVLLLIGLVSASPLRKKRSAPVKAHCSYTARPGLQPPLEPQNVTVNTACSKSELQWMYPTDTLQVDFTNNGRKFRFCLLESMIDSFHVYYIDKKGEQVGLPPAGAGKRPKAANCVRAKNGDLTLYFVSPYTGYLHTWQYRVKAVPNRKSKNKQNKQAEEANDDDDC